MPHFFAARGARAAQGSEAILTGAPLPTMLYFALPILMGNIFQQLYSIVDAIVVGKFLGDLPLSGISVASPIVDVANALIIGGSIGVGVLAAQLCGAADWERLRRMNATALLGGITITLAIALAFTMRTAVGTSLAIITITSLSGLVVHLAAVIPPVAYRNPLLAARVNVEGTRRLIAEAGHAGVRRAAVGQPRAARPAGRRGMPATSAARRAASSVRMCAPVGISTLPPRWPHFFSEASWSAQCTPAAPAAIIAFMSS